MRLIDADALERRMNERLRTLEAENGPYDHYACGYEDAIDEIEDAPTVEAVPVVRCKDCVYFRERHVLLADGTERDYATGEEWFAADVGINVGSQCRREEEPCFRDGCDFCSRGVRKVDDHAAD